MIGHRGFIITLASLGLIVLLVAFAGTLHNNYLSMERALTEPRPLLYTAFVFDDVAENIDRIVGVSVSFTETNTTMIVNIADTIPGNNFTSTLSAYENFLETNLANDTHATIGANFTNMTHDELKIIINEDYTYFNNQTGNESSFKTASAGNTNASSYELNVSIGKTRNTIQHFSFDSEGDLNITLRYTDLNGTGTETGSINSNQTRTFRLTYTDGSYFQVVAGKNNVYDGSLDLLSNADVTFSLAVTLPRINETKHVGKIYDATLEYVQGKSRKTGKIGN